MRSSDMGAWEGPKPPAMGLRRQSRLRPDAISSLLAIATLALGMGACSESPVSFIVLTLKSKTATPIPGVEKIQVRVSK
jgi:hypothetical protein